MRIAKIAIDRKVDCLFDYNIMPDQSVGVGQLVLISFGRQQMVGCVVDIVSEPAIDPGKLKPVLSVLTDRSMLDRPWLDLLKFCAQYYQYPLGAAIFTCLPPAMKKIRLPVLRVDDDTIWYQWVAPENVVISGRAKKQQILLDACKNWQIFSLAQAKTIAKDARARLAVFLENQWISEVSSDVRLPHHQIFQALPSYHLTEVQSTAVDHIIANGQQFQTFLLHGITGSGKTEVYLRVIHHILSLGKQVLVMVPEINLTPQTESRFSARFPKASVIALHSHMSETKRLKHWQAAQSGKADIILGTRLSIFTPIARLGLIVVDEEHDHAYKQFDTLGYHARDLAIWRAKQHHIPAILGSATPSFESYARAREGFYDYIFMEHRANEASRLPDVHLINTTEERPIEGLTLSVKKAIAKRLDQKEQVLVFLNRRGYAPVLFCPACDWQALCADCDVRLVFHRVTKLAHCHHCGFKKPPPVSCPSCGNQDILPIGLGTQRLEETIISWFPDANILRIDRDSMRKKDAFDQVRNQVHDGRANILIGTQMLAKGHDFPNLTLVVIIDADQALYSADYRATERLFSTLLQVSGRAGRGEKAGCVLIQTSFPKHPVYQALMTHDYVQFADSLLQERKAAGFPPYGYQAILRADANNLMDALSFLNQAKRLAMRCNNDQVFCYDPTPMLIAKKAARYRAQLLVESSSRRRLQGFLSKWRKEIDGISTQVRWRFDVDPFEF